MSRAVVSFPWWILVFLFPVFVLSWLVKALVVVVIVTYRVLVWLFIRLPGAHTSR